MDALKSALVEVGESLADLNQEQQLRVLTAAAILLGLDGFAQRSLTEIRRITILDQVKGNLKEQEKQPMIREASG